MPRIWRCLALSILLLPACDSSASRTTESLTPTAPSPRALPAPTSAGFRVSGRVVQATSSGRRVVPSGGIFVWLGNDYGGRVDVDPDGRYAVVGVPAGRLLRLTWTSASETVGLYQVSPVHVSVEGDAERDIEITPTDFPDSACSSPTLAGVVFEVTPQGPRPLVAVRVLYAINGLAGFDVETRTDPRGHYKLCRLPAGVGRLGAGDCNDAVFPQQVEVIGDTSFDVNLTDFYASCPAARPRSQ